MDPKDTPPAGDPVNPSEPLENDAQTPPAPAANGGDPKEAEKLRMQINMLQNKLNEKDKAEAEATRKKLEEDEEYRTLAEQEKARAEELTKQLRQRDLESLTAKVLAEFTPEAREIAEAAGIAVDPTLSDEEAETQLRAKLTVVQDKVGTKAPVAGNNPKPEDKPDEQKALMDKYTKSLDKKTFEEALVASMPSLAQMAENNRRQAS